MAAGLTTLVATTLGVVAFFLSPYNDLGRVYGRVITVFLGLIALNLWVLFRHLLNRFGDDRDLGL